MGSGEVVPVYLQFTPDRRMIHIAVPGDVRDIRLGDVEVALAGDEAWHMLEGRLPRREHSNMLALKLRDGNCLAIQLFPHQAPHEFAAHLSRLCEEEWRVCNSPVPQHFSFAPPRVVNHRPQTASPTRAASAPPSLVQDRSNVRGSRRSVTAVMNTTGKSASSASVGVVAPPALTAVPLVPTSSWEPSVHGTSMPGRHTPPISMAHHSSLPPAPSSPPSARGSVVASITPRRPRRTSSPQMVFSPHKANCSPAQVRWSRPQTSPHRICSPHLTCVQQGPRFVPVQGGTAWGWTTAAPGPALVASPSRLPVTTEISGSWVHCQTPTHASRMQTPSPPPLVYSPLSSSSTKALHVQRLRTEASPSMQSPTWVHPMGTGPLEDPRPDSARTTTLSGGCSAPTLWSNGAVVTAIQPGGYAVTR